MAAMVGRATAHPTTRNSANKNASLSRTAKGTQNIAPRASPKAASSARPIANKASSVAGEQPVNGVTSAYSIMATRIANRMAEMAESITFVERPKATEQSVEPADKRRPRKLEMRLSGNSPDAIAFSAPFLDNTLQKMLALQNRMLLSTAQLSRAEGVNEKLVREHAAQSAELSRIIALICAEKARQGA